MRFYSHLNIAPSVDASNVWTSYACLSPIEHANQVAKHSSPPLGPQGCVVGWLPILLGETPLWVNHSSLSQSMKHRIKESRHQGMNQLINQTIDSSINQLTDQQIRRSAQSIDRSINRSII